ncbi:MULTISPECIES: hypothetical protein [unclassified Streptomyces]|uniref:hypothetical protein n=1 Tax=unclassified Streptomyces TaxID=2593676 RepID=UPI000A5D1E30|nr:MULTISPECIES: hypothetical protein [unclassified Streptomyces]
MSFLAPEPPPATDGTTARLDARTWSVTAAQGTEAGIRFTLPGGPAVLLDAAGDDRYLLPADGSSPVELLGSGACWLLPADPDAAEPAWHLLADGPIGLRVDGDGRTVTVHAPSATLVAHRARPHADVDGAEFTLDLPGAQALADALAGFYWGTVLPCVVERTTAAGYPDPDGYVISTLADTYVGTYPDVDHEFQIKARLAWGSRTDQDVVRRMIDLQLRLMREDPQQLWRDPCAVQPDGDREYHVRRASADGSRNAVMFLVTGNVEVLESAWLYYARTKDADWLRDRVEDLEGAASCVVGCVDPLGRLWSDVYYEDQVIKDGRETMAASLAAHSFLLLADLEDVLGRAEQARLYRELAGRLGEAVRAPLPAGYWDGGSRRFVDWVDRSGRVHDHVHLLANVLPAMFGQADAVQTAHVLALVDGELEEFQRFPTFLAARVADYTDDEIGDGGPYDLCAAGRYWCWDAAFWSWRRDGAMLRRQLDTVAAQGARDGYVMGERYDMDHVHYVDGSDWHGAAHYYEYPCVFAWVLFAEYLGVRASLTADLRLAPRVVGRGTVTLGQRAYQLTYRIDEDGFELVNTAGHARTFEVDLSGVGGTGSSGVAAGGAPVAPGSGPVAPGSMRPGAGLGSGLGMGSGLDLGPALDLGSALDMGPGLDRGSALDVGPGLDRGSALDVGPGLDFGSGLGAPRTVRLGPGESCRMALPAPGGPAVRTGAEARA